MDKICVSASQLASFLVCNLKCLENIKSKILKTQVSSTSANLGTEVHNIISLVMRNAPINEISAEASNIILAPNPTVENMFYTKYKKVVKFDPAYSEKENLLLLEKQYGRVKQFSEDQAVIYTNDEHSDCTPISMIDLFHPKMFGKPLTRFEYQFESELDSGFFISGKCDALSEDGSLIVDWKTASATPKKDLTNSISFQYFHYLAQLAVYRILYCHHMNIPISPCNAILAYIIKTKTPKFYPIAYKLTQPFLDFINNKLNECLISIKNYFDNKILPQPTFGDHCDFCFYKDRCLELYPIAPELDAVSAIRTEYITCN